MNFNAKDKYKSMLRAYDRLKRINTDTGNEHGNTEANDATEDFFNQCYHLKDWIKKDSNVKLNDDVEQYINNSKYLAIAADYCNIFKHAGLDKKSRSNQKIESTNTHVRFDLTSRGFVASSKFEISIDGKKYNSLILAESCIKEWDTFLRSYSLNFTE